ncbi:hypothetical protein JTE90_020488 [Oedothorax gibbosus]|uniref:Homeobox domain-containing protein n=1 Tax=Oedothorax gibbosus TaxID=931172 RepID=A0AAV6UQS4_9ARAC|nr:hypothetical protein JTE90_020488 [Oedothorax gibbosus]
MKKDRKSQQQQKPAEFDAKVAQIANCRDGWDISAVSHPVCHASCKRKEEQQQQQPKNSNTPKKPRLVFTDLQRRTLQAIFKETKRPSKEMQITISQQLGLELSTVGNFFMNARRRSQDKWQDTEDKVNKHHHHQHHLLHLSPTAATS